MLDLVDGLYTYDEPGFNQLEGEHYYQHVLSNEGQLLAYQELAEKVAKSKGIAIDKVYEKFLHANDNPSEALGFFGAYFVEVQLLQAKQLSSERNRPFAIAEMILRSRLKPTWLQANLVELTDEYGPLFTPDELGVINDLHRCEWLSDATRERALHKLVSILSKQQIRKLVAFAENELMEGTDPQSIPTELSEVLGKPASESSERKTRSQPQKDTPETPISVLPHSA